MAGGVTLSVRQIGSFPLVGAAGAGDLILTQPGGLGNPYAAITAQALVATALSEEGGPIGIGITPPAGAVGDQIVANDWITPSGGSILWNCYFAAGGLTNWLGGLNSTFGFDQRGWVWELGGVGAAGSLTRLTNAMVLSPTGALSLPLGTLTVARDPATALEVATMGWVGANTVASFNGRQGAVTLNGCDVYSALCLTDQIATEPWVNANIQASIQMLLANHPFVFGWNGRTGAVYLTLADISCVFFQPGQQPITQTPPPTSDDYSIANTAWVTNYVQSEFAGTGGLATQAWVLANTVNTFNGRYGVVTLNTADITGAGGAPINSPQFTGVPQAPTATPGTASGQLATTLFVQEAIVQNTTGVVSFNTRTGAIVLEAADLNAAGGALLASPVFTGTPTAPTAAVGTNTTQLATTAFVLAEVQAIGAGVLSFNTRTGIVTLSTADITGAGGAPIASPVFTGNPTVPTPTSPVAATTSIANTNWVVQYNALNTVASFNGRIGAVTLSAADVSGAGALVNPSPALTGTPTAPTPAPTDNSTTIATTAYVHAALANFAGVISFNTRTGAVVLTAADLTGAGGALIASPTFTGTPAAPTAAPGTSTTQLATTAFVAQAIASSGVASWNGRTGAVVLTSGDVSGVGGALLAGPTFTGVPTAPTAPPGTSTTQLATTAFVTGALGSYLPLSGGTLSGALTVGTSLTVSGNTINAPSAQLNLVNVIATGTVNSATMNTTGNATFNGTMINNYGMYTTAVAGIAPGSSGSFGFGIDTASNTSTIGFTVGINGTPFGWAIRSFQTAGVTQGYIAIAGNAFGTNMTAFGVNNVQSTWTTTTSDARLKRNLGPPTLDALRLVNTIAVQQCDWSPAHMPDYSEHWDFTIVAQDVAADLPFAYVAPHDDNGYATLAPLHLIATLWRAVQQLSAEIDALKGAAA